MLAAADRAPHQAKGSPMMPVPDACVTLRFSTEGMPEERRAQAVRDLHLHERTILSARLEPIEPLEPLPDHPLYVDLTKRTLPGLAVVSGTLSGLRQSIRPSGAVANGEDDVLLGVNVSGRLGFLPRPTPAFWNRQVPQARISPSWSVVRRGTPRPKAPPLDDNR